MPRTAIDVHHILVHFPIALILLAAFLQLLAVWRNSASLHFAAKANLILGAVSGIVTVTSGLLAEEGYRHRLLETHESLAIGTTVFAALMAIAWIRRPVEPRSRGSYLLLGALLLAGAAVGTTGYFGGEMAFGHGRRAQDGDVPEDVAQGRALFESKCTRCHGAARALDAVLPAADWPAVVARMAAKSGSITADEQAAIIRYLQSRSGESAAPGAPPAAIPAPGR